MYHYYSALPAPNQGLKVPYSISGTATVDEDYQVSQSTGEVGELNIAPGETEAAIALSAIDDDIYESAESITINLKSVGEGYQLDPNAQVTLLQLQDNEPQPDSDAEGTTQLAEQVGGLGNDELDGDSGSDRLKGGYGNDTLRGQQGNDLLQGGHSEDFLVGGTDEDTLEGHFGEDTQEKPVTTSSKEVPAATN